MSGRPVQILAAAAFAAAASFVSIDAASAGCYSGCGYSYSAPVAYYQAPVVYSYSYAPPVTYAAPCSPCGYSYGYGYAPRPAYVVNQGPTYSEPVMVAPEPAPSDGYSYGYGRSYPSYEGGSYRWRHRGYGYRAAYGYRGYGYRAAAPRYGYRAYGPRFGYRAAAPRFGYRAYGPSYGYRHHGPRFAAGPRPRFAVPYRARPMHMMRAPHMMHRAPGAVHPMPIRRKN
jgi:hypothetical protein